MKIAVAVYQDNAGTPYRKFCIKPVTEDELYDATEDVVSFINETYAEIADEEN